MPDGYFFGRGQRGHTVHAGLPPTSKSRTIAAAVDYARIVTSSNNYSALPAGVIRDVYLVDGTTAVSPLLLAPSQRDRDGRSLGVRRLRPCSVTNVGRVRRGSHGSVIEPFRTGSVRLQDRCRHEPELLAQFPCL